MRSHAGASSLALFSVLASVILASEFPTDLGPSTTNASMGDTHQEPFVHELGQHGFIQGVSIAEPLCRYFGGIRYALPPSERWQRAKALPSNYTYGTNAQPAKYSAETKICYQPKFLAPLDLSGSDEDSFQLNIWVPAGEAPENGWPVFVFFHGGFMQFGSPNDFNMAGLLSETDFKAIVVMPAYRLNIFGFLYSAELEEDPTSGNETVGNYGFWDQRLALEWVRDSIHFFKGDSQSITVAGYSAGANSAFYQLAYDLWQPDEKSIIKRVVMWSNAPGFQPKSPAEAQVQFNEVISALGIEPFLPGSAKLARLRALPAEKLIEALSSPRLQLHQFRPITDSAFVSRSLFESLHSGEFAARLRQRNIRLMLGEVANEPAIYRLWRPPLENSLDGLRKRLTADYSTPIVDALTAIYFPDGRLPPNNTDWNHDVFGKVYADMQVHVSQRGFINALVKGGVSDLLYRYKIGFRAKAVDNVLPLEYGATHTTDQFLWFWGNRFELEQREKDAVNEALVAPLAKFVQGQEDIDWGTKSYQEIRTFKSDGGVEIQLDSTWDSAIDIWAKLQEATEEMSK